MRETTIEMLQAARAAERAQALFYRRLAALAEDADDPELSERLNGLHADEQHHLSRLTVRLVELGEAVAELDGMQAPVATLDGWEAVAREREKAEIERYEALLGAGLDAKTRTMIEQFIEAERGHAGALGGKWMGAEP